MTLGSSASNACPSIRWLGAIGGAKAFTCLSVCLSLCWKLVESHLRKSNRMGEIFVVWLCVCVCVFLFTCALVIYFILFCVCVCVFWLGRKVLSIRQIVIWLLSWVLNDFILFIFHCTFRFFVVHFTTLQFVTLVVCPLLFCIYLFIFVVVGLNDFIYRIMCVGQKKGLTIRPYGWQADATDSHSIDLKLCCDKNPWNNHNYGQYGENVGQTQGLVSRPEKGPNGCDKCEKLCSKSIFGWFRLQLSCKSF